MFQQLSAFHVLPLVEADTEAVRSVSAQAVKLRFVKSVCLTIVKTQRFELTIGLGTVLSFTALNYERAQPGNTPWLKKMII
jgi:hypothetical protein